VVKDQSWVELRLAVMRISKFDVDILVTLNTPPPTISDNSEDLDTVFGAIVNSLTYAESDLAKLVGQ
jgi:hypothetical protein